MSIEKLRADIEAVKNSHDAGCHSSDCSCERLLVLRALLEEHERMEDLAMECQHTWKVAQEAIQRYGESE